MADMGGLGATQNGPGANGTCVNFNVTSMAGSLGVGGSTTGQNCGCEGYGGGGGYYGGAASGNCRGGGGGSSYIAQLSNGVTYSGGRAIRTSSWTRTPEHRIVQRESRVRK